MGVINNDYKPDMEVGKLIKNEYIRHLKCRECGEEFPPIKIYACRKCFGPLEVIYDLNAISLNKRSFATRTKSLWRYRELLPVLNRKKIVDLGAGFTTLHECKRLAKTLGIKKLFVKDDTVNPTGSFKDRPASVAVSKASEFGYNIIGCASTGNLAAATAAHAAKAGIPCYVFLPENTETNKILQAATYGANIIAVKGTYDEANRLAAQVAHEYNWAFVNINTRPYYTEGSKTLALEVCEQLKWKAPENIIIPMGSGALLCAMWRGFNQFLDLDLISQLKTRVFGAQPVGCSPIVNAYESGLDEITPIETPKTIAKSLAIGDPGDGIYALNTIRQSKGVAGAATNLEILNGIKLLGKMEGIFSEPAGGVTVAILKKLLESGEISRDEEVVCCVTGSGFKSANTILETIQKPLTIKPSIEEFKKII
jgi:threonine synthase